MPSRDCRWSSSSKSSSICTWWRKQPSLEAPRSLLPRDGIWNKLVIYSCINCCGSYRAFTSTQDLKRRERRRGGRWRANMEEFVGKRRGMLTTGEWCMLLTGLHHSPVVSIPLLLSTNSSIFPLHLPPLLISLVCTRVRCNYHHQPFTFQRWVWRSYPVVRSWRWLRDRSLFLVYTGYYRFLLCRCYINYRNHIRNPNY